MKQGDILAGNGVCCATALRKASRRVAQLYDAALAPSGLRSTQYAILVEIGRHGDLAPTMSELAEALVMDRSSLGHNLRPLARDGLLEITPGAQDRRRRCISLTADGRKRITQARRHWQRAQDQFHAAFGQDNAAALRSTLLRIAADDRLVASS